MPFGVYQRMGYHRGIIGLLFLFGCTPRSTDRQDKSEVAPKPTKRLDPNTGATLTGTVTFAGVSPPPTMLSLAGDGACLKARPGGFDVKDVVVTDGNVANAFVWIAEGLEDYAFDPPTGVVTVDQVGCMYAPRVIGARTGQEILFKNSDETNHNVSGAPKNSPNFNFVTIVGGSAKRRVKRSEVMVKIGCDIHPWMSAYVGVVDHPYFATTGKDGTFKLEGLPREAVTLRVWHERLGTKEMQVSLTPREKRSLSVMLPGP